MIICLKLEKLTGILRHKIKYKTDDNRRNPCIYDEGTRGNKNQYRNDFYVVFENARNHIVF